MRAVVLFSGANGFFEVPCVLFHGVPQEAVAHTIADCPGPVRDRPRRFFLAANCAHIRCCLRCRRRVQLLPLARWGGSVRAGPPPLGRRVRCSEPVTDAKPSTLLVHAVWTRSGRLGSGSVLVPSAVTLALTWHHALHSLCELRTRFRERARASASSNGGYRPAAPLSAAADVRARTAMPAGVGVFGMGAPGETPG